LSSDFESISSTYIHEWRGNRRCHGVVGNPYFLPNDDEEMIRLDELHFVLRKIYKHNVLAPIGRLSKSAKILDMGTGSGRWAIEVADQFPTAEVYGVDLSPTQPTDVPENCEFCVGDFTELEDLDFAEASFDLVHSRLVQSGIVKECWPRYINNIYSLLKPGTGWVQLGEFSVPQWEPGAVPEDSYYAQFRKYVDELCVARNILPGGEHLEQTLKDGGFVDIEVSRKVIDIGDWRGGIATSSLRSARRSCRTFVLGAIKPLAWNLSEQFPDEEERMAFAEKVAQECQDTVFHQYLIMHTVVGRKPMVPSR